MTEAAAGGEPTEAGSADPLRTLKQTLLNLRGLHLQLRTAMLAGRQVIGSLNGSEPQYDDFIAVVNALAELNLAMGQEQVALLDEIHAAERAAAKLH